MSQPIWPVVLENLAEQLSATQGGIVHPVQLLPYIPVNLQQIEQTLDALTNSSRVEALIKELRARGILSSGRTSSTLDLPPMRYPKAAFERNDQFIRQFPEAIKDEVEARVIKGLIFAVAVLFLCFILLVTAKVPFPLLFVGGLITASIGFLKIFRAPSKKLPNF